MDVDDMYRLGLWTQRFRDAYNILPFVKGEGRLLDGLGQVHVILNRYSIGMRCAHDISEWRTKLESKYKGDVRLDKEDAKELVMDSAGWKEEIHTYLKRKQVLEIAESGLNPSELLKLANKELNKFIEESFWTKLTGIEKSDFSDAAKCLLLGTATPSVMVALRGAEASVREFYRCKMEEDPRKKTWRQLTKELKSQAGELGIADTFIGYLDYIGEAKRNFAQHPNKIYSLREAVLIFMQVVGLVEDIYVQI